MSRHAINFRDADFPHRSAWCWSKLEGLHLRWVPYGMPRLSPALSHSVFFLYEKDFRPGAAPDALIGPEGSGVIVGTLEPGELTTSFYAVTAAHVVSDGASIIWLNTRDGRSRPIEFDPCEWSYDFDKFGDIAAVDITDRLKRDGDEFSHVPLGLFATRNSFRYGGGIGVGEDGFMLGLFTEHSGTTRNLVAARFGNVSMLADDAVPIPCDIRDGLTVTTPCHVFDIHSRPGFSGSPVFVYRTPDSDLRDAEFGFPKKYRKFTIGLSNVESQLMRARGRGDETFEVVENIDSDSRFLCLLGIHMGQFRDEVEIAKVGDEESSGRGCVVQKRTEKKTDPVLKDSDSIRFPGSMTLVVPAWDIIELLEGDKNLKAQREARNERDKLANRNNPKRGSIVLERAALRSKQSAGRKCQGEVGHSIFPLDNDA